MVIASFVEFLNLLILVTSELVIRFVECSEDDSPPYTITYDLDDNSLHVRFDIDFEVQPSWNLDSYPAAPFVSNVVVTGQEEPFQVMDAGETFTPKVLTYYGESVTEESGLDYYYHHNTSNDNCSSTNSSSPACGSSWNLPPRAPTFQHSALTRVIVLLLIAIFSLVGNIATLSSILRTGRQGTSTVYMLLVQLAIADLLVSIFCILADALWTLSVQWYGGNFLCKAVKFMQLFSLYLSTFLLVLIGFDRLCAVRFPMRRARAKHHVRTGIVCVWALSALFSLPQVFIFSVMRGPFAEDFYQCVTYGFYTAQWQEQLYTTLSLVLMFLLPLLVLVSTYIATFLTIASQENMFHERVSRSAIDSARQKILRKAKIKSLMITVVIVLTFVICWTPYYVTMIIFMFLDPSEQLSQDLQKAIFFFGSSTAAINPLIYGAFHLRPMRRCSKSGTANTSLVNNHSYSSRLETYSHILTFRSRSHGRKSREENVDLHVINGDLLVGSGMYKHHRYSYVSNIEHHRNSRRIVHHQNSVPY